MNYKNVSSAFAASAVLAMGVLGIASNTASNAEEQFGAEPVPTIEATTGETSTATAAISTPATPRATPSITGPAPLPPEEEGLPG